MPSVKYTTRDRYLSVTPGFYESIRVLDDSLGSLASGYAADAVLLSDELQVAGVWAAGNQLVEVTA